MTFTKGQRVVVNEQPPFRALEDVGAPSECDCEHGVVIDGEVSGTPPQLEIRFDGEIEDQTDWFIPVSCLKAL